MSLQSSRDASRRPAFTLITSAPQAGAAFTLIELLVVIAIVTLLAAILFPVFAQARAKARQTACLSNMKQIGMAVALYSQDYDERIVPSHTEAQGAYLVSWPSLIMPYVRSAGVFVCPAAGETPSPPDRSQIRATTRLYAGITTGTAAFGGDGSRASLCLVPRLSYSRNLIPTTNGDPWNALASGRRTNNGKTYPGFVDYRTNLKSGWVGRGTTFSLSLSEVGDPAGTIHVVDGMAGGGPRPDPTGYGDSMSGLQQDIRTDLFDNDTPSKVSGRHNNGFVILYGDGHSGWKRWGSTDPCMWTIQDDRCP